MYKGIKKLLKLIHNYRIITFWLPIAMQVFKDATRAANAYFSMNYIIMYPNTHVLSSLILFGCKKICQLTV